jgi:hypothetical protein
MKQFFARLHRADRVLSTLGWLQIFVVFLAVCSAPWDRSALDATVNPWYKVIRYAAALTIYAWTLALFVQHIPNQAKLLQFVRWGTFVCLCAETAGITVQAIRGLPSHYNTSGTGNAIIFAVIGLAILFNTLIAFLVLFLFLWEDVDLPRAYLMGIRLGFVLFTIGSLEGMIMIINQAPTIGAGDLRFAHVAGIFGIQVLPLAGWSVHRLMKDRGLAGQLVLVTAIAGLWVVLMMRLFHQALAGRPIFGA